MQIVTLIFSVVALLTYISTSIWVFVDAKNIEKKSGKNTKPWIWLIACIGLWIVAYPMYIFYRGGTARTIGFLVILPIMVGAFILSKSHPIDMDNLNESQADNTLKNRQTKMFFSEISGVWQSEESIITFFPTQGSSAELLVRHKNVYAQIIFGKIIYAKSTNLSLDNVNNQVVISFDDNRKMIVRKIMTDNQSFSLLIANDASGAQEQFSFMRLIDSTDQNTLENLRASYENQKLQSSLQKTPPLPVQPNNSPTTSVVNNDKAPVTPEQQITNNTTHENLANPTTGKSAENTELKTDVKRFKPSFDCNIAHSSVEKMICNNKELSLLDVNLNTAYRNFVTSTKGSYDASTIRNEQLEWLRNDRNKCTTEECLVSSYQNRIHEIKSKLNTN